MNRNICEDKDVFFIIKDNESLIGKQTYAEAAIFVHLHYIQLLPIVICYLKQVPDYVKVYISSSNEKLLGDLKDLLEQQSPEMKCLFMLKENRGRDISSFLVTFREIMKKYKYIGFVHDKWKKAEDSLLETEKFMSLLWDSFFGNVQGKKGQYIGQVLNLFYTNPKLGLLIPPAPIGKYLSANFCNTWSCNFENTKRLCEQLKVKSNIDKEKSPMTLGTVFWARTDAIRKLLDVNWQYTDFPPEPLADDGTISHAVERVLSFIAEDAGYDSGYIMTEGTYHSRYIRMEKLLTSISNVLGIGAPERINDWPKQMAECIEFCKRYSRIGIYGAGKIGHLWKYILENEGVFIDFYCVSHANGQSEAWGIPIIEWDRLKEHIEAENIGIILAVGYRAGAELLPQLESELSDRLFCID